MCVFTCMTVCVSHACPHRSEEGGEFLGPAVTVG